VLTRLLPALSLVLGGALACSSASEGSIAASPPDPSGGTGAEALGPSCDEDNPIQGAPAGTVDRPLPETIIQFERQHQWGCAHREWHESRQWEYIAKDPKQASRFAYATQKNWKAAAQQEGAPGSGLDFLAMHRAMVVTLRERFPQHAELFKGWTTVPTASTEADPLPSPADGGSPTPFYKGMKEAIARVETDPMSFATDDELGLFLETRHRPTPGKPFDQTPDLTTGLHAFIHSRFDDPRSPIHMELFARNIENQTFFRFHGWIDRIWTQWRTARSMNDATDTAYGEAMHHACMHMRLGMWDGSRCTQ
jgi:hypothetical protein